MFNINAQLVSMSARRTLTDANGAALGQVRKKKTPGLHVTYYLGTMNDEKKCAVKAKGYVKENDLFSIGISNMNLEFHLISTPFPHGGTQTIEPNEVRCRHISR